MRKNFSAPCTPQPPTQRLIFLLCAVGSWCRLVLSAAAHTQELQPRLLQLFDVVSRSPHSYKYLRFLANCLLLIFPIKSFSHLKIIFIYTVYFPQLQCLCPILLSYIYVCVYICMCNQMGYVLIKKFTCFQTLQEKCKNHSRLGCW